MIPFLTESPSPAVPAPAMPFQPGAGGSGPGGRTGLDFAGLLDIALPAEVDMGPHARPSEADIATAPATDMAAPVPAEIPLPAAMPGFARPPVLQPDAIPSGTILPESGEALPPSGMDVPPVAPGAQGPVSPETEDTSDAPGLSAGEPTVMPAAVIAVRIAAVPVPVTEQTRPALPAAVLSPAAIREPAGPPVRVALPAPPASQAPVGEDTPASPGSAVLLSDASEGAAQSATASAPGASAPQPSTPAIAPASSTVAPFAERAEVRAPAPQLESTIHQVGEIREALRAARPEMTVRHAEFGLVSLRIEATGAAQDWRAVLASRDPGFVPAIHAALAERAVSASADSAATGNGTGAGAGQGGFSEQRYGFSQGSGQGSSQPYPPHSGQRDEGASQHQRPQQRQADEAASAAAPDGERPQHRESGLFA